MVASSWGFSTTPVGASWCPRIALLDSTKSSFSEVITQVLCNFQIFLHAFRYVSKGANMVNQPWWATEQLRPCSKMRGSDETSTRMSLNHARRRCRSGTLRGRSTALGCLGPRYGVSRTHRSCGFSDCLLVCCLMFVLVDEKGRRGKEKIRHCITRRGMSWGTSCGSKCAVLVLASSCSSHVYYIQKA